MKNKKQTKKKVTIKRLAEFPDYYVTSTGEVLSSKNGKMTTLKPCYKLTGQRGYIQVHLYVDGIRHNRYVHRLVAETFLGNRNTELEVNHMDLDKHNNDVSNLEWCTRKENVNHYWDTIRG